MFVLTLVCAFALAASQFANVRLPCVYTGRPLDVAIDGPGYFQLVAESDESQIYYTRNGRFWVDSSSQIRAGTLEQKLLLYPVQALPMGSQVKIDLQGYVCEWMPGTSLPTSTIGCVQLALFSNPDGLQEISPGLFSATDEAGAPISSTPGENGIGTCSAGWLELSDPYRRQSALSISPAILVAFLAGGGAGFLCCRTFFRS